MNDDPKERRIHLPAPGEVTEEDTDRITDELMVELFGDDEP